MRWFKHFTDMHRGQSINKLMDELGHTGLCFFLLQEMCADKLEKEFGERATEADCSFVFHRRIVRQNLRISAVNLLRLLDVCSEVGQLSYAFSGNSLQINMPILLKLLERDTKSAITHRRAAVKPCPPDIEEDKEIDIEEDKELLKQRQKHDKDENSRIWQSYFNAYRLRYSIDPIRNAQINSQVAALRKKLGANEACSVIDFYLTHNDSWYLKSTHSFGLCLKDAESLRTQMLRGKAITLSDARKGEQNIKILENFNKAKEGGF